MEDKIKNLQEIIDLCEEDLKNNHEDIHATLDFEDLKSLQFLLIENNRLKEIEKAHQNKNGQLRTELNCSEQQLNSLKSKINEKIKELESYRNNIPENNIYKFYGVIDLAIEVLKELSKKGE